MDTKQINDLVSFVAMVAVDGYDNEKVSEWVLSQNLNSEVRLHLDRVLETLSKSSHIALVWRYGDDKYYVKQGTFEPFADFKKRVYDAFRDSYHIEFYLAHPTNK